MGSASVVRDADFVSSLQDLQQCRGTLALPVPSLDDCLLGRVGVTADHPGESGRGSATPRVWQTPKGRWRSWVHVRVKKGPQVGPGEARAQGRRGGPPEAGVLNNGGV